jgi:hypothetical protein
MFIELGQPGVRRAALVAGGLLLIKAWLREKQITNAQAIGVIAQSRQCDLSDENLRLLLDSDIDTDAAGHAWLTQLQRQWPRIRNLISIEGSCLAIEPPSFRHRARGQLRAAAEFPSPTHRGALLDHRHLSPNPFQRACNLVREWQEADDWRGVYAVVTAVSHLSIDLVGQIPLSSTDQDGAWLVQIDDGSGCVRTDFSFLVPGAAKGEACSQAVPSSFVTTTFLPSKAARSLRSRRLLYPGATTLADLYPEAPPTGTRDAIFQSNDEIKPSWARWTASFGVYMRRAGHDNLLSSIASNDFGHVPKSKIFYAAASHREIRQASDSFYQTLGWGPAESDHDNNMAFGSRVVPAEGAVRRAFDVLVSDLAAARPRRHSTANEVIEFHNQYAKVVAFQLAVVLALRESKSYCLFADLDESVDLWLDIEDKSTPGPDGALPVPLCSHVRRCIGQYRSHCAALVHRLRRTGHAKTAVFQWAHAVSQRERVPLLCIATSPDSVEALGSHAVFGRLPSSHALPSDVGRKVLENEGRHYGLRSGDIDALLRHDVLGQSRAASSSDFLLIEWVRRVTPFLDSLAASTFGARQQVGLTKE